MIPILCLVLTVASWIYWLVAWWLTRTFLRARRTPLDADPPPVSILKPVKGLDVEAEENFYSFCRQDYPTYELLFGVEDADDPVIPVIERVQAAFPTLPIRLIIAPAQGLNRKACLLHALAREARHALLVVSDSDMRVTPDYLRRVVAPLADPRVGLVTCLYRGRDARTLTARLEALHMGVTFLPSAVVARKFLDMRFAMGATVALRRSVLEQIGGFAALADYLADDYQLGARVAALGLRVQLSDYIVESVLGATTFREQWGREVRWARCNRVSRPAEYPGLLLTFSTPLALLALIASGFSGWGWATLVGSLLCRWLVGWLITGYTRDRTARRWLFWLPVRDMLSALVWCVGGLGRSVTWRGVRLRVRADGRLAPAPPPSRGLGGRLRYLLAGAVRGLDALLRRAYHIVEFSQSPDCLLRVRLVLSDEARVLSDGTSIARGDPLVEIHFWNEHLPIVPPGGPDLAWALAFRRQLAHSLRELAAYLEADPRFAEVKALRGEDSFGSWYDPAHMAVLVRHWGFDLVPKVRGTSLWQRFGAFWENLYALALIWAYNPHSIGHVSQVLRRDRLWMSRRVLLSRYGLPPASTVAVPEEVCISPRGHSRP